MPIDGIEYVNTIASNNRCRFIDELPQVVLCDLVNCKIMGLYCKVGVKMYLVQQRPLYIPAGNILVLLYPELRMPTLLRQVKKPFIGLVEISSIVNNFTN